MAEQLTAIERFVEAVPFQAPEVPVWLEMPVKRPWPETNVGDFRLAAECIAFVRKYGPKSAVIHTSTSEQEPVMHALAIRIEAASTDAGGRGEADA